MATSKRGKPFICTHTRYKVHNLNISYLGVRYTCATCNREFSSIEDLQKSRKVALAKLSNRSKKNG